MERWCGLATVSGWLCPGREPWDNDTLPGRRQCHVILCSSACCLGLFLAPSLLSSPLLSPPPPLRFAALFSSTCFISHALLHGPFLNRCLSSPQCLVTRAKLGPRRGVSHLRHTLPDCANPRLNPNKPSWDWDFSQTPSYPCSPRHARAGSPWPCEMLAAGRVT